MVSRARTNLLDFTRFTFGGSPPYVVNWHHRVLARELDKAIETPGSRTMVLLPPQVGKTELATRRAAAYAIGRNPNEQVIAATYSGDWARQFGIDVQRIIRSEEYQALFPDVRLRKAGDKEVAVSRQDYFKVVGHNGFFKAVGREQGIAGWPGSLCLIDDVLKNQEEAISASAREQCWRFFTAEILRRIGEDARIIIVNTRRSRDDLCGRLLRQQPDRWRVMELPSIRKAEKTHPDDPRKEGDALWPRHKSLKTLEEEQRLDPAIFAAVDQQDPSEAGGTEWSPHLFDGVLVPRRLFPRNFQARLVTIDPSKGKSDKKGDYSALIFLGFAQRLLWVAAHIERIPLNRITGKLLGWCNEWQPDAVGIESVQFQELLCHNLERESAGGFGQQYNPIPMETGGLKKEFRIRRLNPYIADRKIRVLDDEGNHGRRLIDQLMDFPVGEHDDGPDALEMAERLAGEVCRGR